MTKKTSLDEESDEDLFLYMACRDTPKEVSQAEDACEVLHHRYIDRLFKRCFNMLKSYPDAHTRAAELASAALFRAYERAETYKIDENCSNPSARTLKWLARIARNIFRDTLRNPKRPNQLNVVDLEVNTEHYDSSDFAALFLGENDSVHSEELKIRVAEAYDSLKPRAQTVLLETLIQRDRSPGRKYMLRGSARVLADRLDTTPENLRRIRHNGVKAINAYVEKHMNQTTEAGDD